MALCSFSELVIKTRQGVSLCVGLHENEDKQLCVCLYKGTANAQDVQGTGLARPVLDLSTWLGMTLL